MMKKYNFVRTLIAGVALTMAIYPQAWAASSGTCGGSCTWTLSDDGHLDIQGSGDMSWNTGISYTSTNVNGRTELSNWSGSRSYAPWDQSKVKSINIGKNITSIASTSFYNASNVTSITIEQGSKLKSVGDFAFAGTGGRSSDALLSINLPDTVESIGIMAFYVGPRSTTLNLPTSLKTIGDYAFYQSRVNELDFSMAKDLKSIPPLTYNSEYLEKVILPPNLETIGSNAFRDCKNLRELILPETLKTIGQVSLWGTAITDIKIPESVEKIEGYALPSSIQKIDLSSAKNLYLFDNALYGASENAKLICTESQISSGVCNKESLTRAAYKGTLVGKGKGYYATYDQDGNVIAYYENLADIDSGNSMTKAEMLAMVNSKKRTYYTPTEAVAHVNHSNNNKITFTFK